MSHTQNIKHSSLQLQAATKTFYFLLFYCRNLLSLFISVCVCVCFFNTMLLVHIQNVSSLSLSLSLSFSLSLSLSLSLCFQHNAVADIQTASFLSLSFPCPIGVFTRVGQ